MVDFAFREHYGIEDLIEIVRLLREPGGCPWDREQDHRSIRKNLLEEAYEVAQAIDDGDNEELREELGDLLLQIVLHSRMEEEEGTFDFEDVCNDICQKLIVRHPHVFAQTQVSSTGEVLRNWEAIKEKTKGQTTASQTLECVPRALPALMRAGKVQHRAAKVGFQYPDVTEAMVDLESEVVEVRDALESGEKSALEEELGDLLFSCVNVSRMLGLEPEEILGRATDKFIRRFTSVESMARDEGTDMKACSLERLRELWAKAKMESE